MNNFRPFDETYIEVTMPLDDKTITALTQSERYAALLDDLYSAQDNSAYETVSCTMTVAFDFVSMATFFSIETICCTTDGYTDKIGTSNIDLDPITAEYFKAEALKHLMRNMNAMKACQPSHTAVSV